MISLSNTNTNINTNMSNNFNNFFSLPAPEHALAKANGMEEDAGFAPIFRPCTQRSRAYEDFMYTRALRHQQEQERRQAQRYEQELAARANGMQMKGGVGANGNGAYVDHGVADGTVVAKRVVRDDDYDYDAEEDEGVHVEDELVARAQAQGKSSASSSSSSHPSDSTSMQVDDATASEDSLGDHNMMTNGNGGENSHSVSVSVSAGISSPASGGAQSPADQCQLPAAGDLGVVDLEANANATVCNGNPSMKPSVSNGNPSVCSKTTAVTHITGAKGVKRQRMCDKTAKPLSALEQVREADEGEREGAGVGAPPAGIEDVIMGQ